MSKDTLKIAWAFDPYSDISNTWQRAKEFIAACEGKTNVTVSPMYVLGSEQLGWVGHMEPPQLDHVLPYVEKAVESKLSSLDIKVDAPVVLKNAAGSKSSDIEVLLKACTDGEYDLILINTHARTGVSRLFMGSFAETLALKSTIPVVFVTPNEKAIEKFDNVLFPTNLSAESFHVYRTFLAKYGSMIKEVTLLTKILRPINAFAESGITALGGAWVAPEAYLETENEQRKKTAAEWSAEAKKYDVSCKLEIDDELGDVADSVEKYEKENDIDCVVVGSFATRVEAVLIGSVSRQIVRQADVPVMVFHRQSE